MERKEIWSLVPHSGLRARLTQGDVLAGRYIVAGRLEARAGCDAYVVQDLDHKKHYTMLIPRREQEGGYATKRVNELVENAQCLLAHRDESLCLRDLLHVDGSWAFITDQWVRKSLAQIVTEQGALEERRVLLLMIDVARALRLAHSTGVFHGGFGPESVFIRPGDGHVALCGFGLFVPYESTGDDELTLTDGNSESYLSAYLSPEAVGGTDEPRGPQGDVWAFGLCLYFVLAGKLPFAEQSLSGITSAIQGLHPHQLRKLGLRPELRSILIGCLEQDPQERFTSLEPVLASLLSIHRGLDTVPDSTPDSCGARMLRWSKRLFRQ